MATKAKGKGNKGTTKPAAKPAAAAPAAAQEVTFGVKDLANLIKEETGKEVTTRELRTLLRKMARDNRIDREIIPGNRARYDWAGPEDPEVQAALAAFKSGELDEDKKQKLAELKKRKDEQKAAKKAAEVEEDDEEEEEDLEEEEDEDEDED